MRVIVDIEDKKAPFFIKLVKSLDFINGIEKVKNGKKDQLEKDLKEAFEEVKLFEQGKKKLKNAKDFLHELEDTENRGRLSKSNCSYHNYFSC